jgi:glycine cleavage system H protein
MKIDKYEFPDDLYYDKEHNWARVEGDVVTQGLTDFGQDLAGEIVYAEVPRVGRDVQQGQPFMSMESGKWVGRIKAIVSGKIAEANEEIEWESTVINDDPYGDGWLAKIEAADPGELDNLMRPSDPAFAEFIAAEREKYDK